MINLLSPVCSYAIRKIPMDGCRITFSLRLHVIQHPSIGIFPYCVNKQGITNNIKWRAKYFGYHWKEEAHTPGDIFKGYFGKKMYPFLGTVHKHLLGGGWCKRGPLTTFDPCIFQLSLHTFLLGWLVIFIAKRGPEIFWGLKRGPEKFSG